MGRVLAEALAAPVVLLLLGFGVLRTVRYFRNLDHREKAQQHGWAIDGDLNRAQELLLLSSNLKAEAVFRSLISPVDRDSWDDSTILSAHHRTEIGNWLNELETINKQLRKR